MWFNKRRITLFFLFFYIGTTVSFLVFSEETSYPFSVNDRDPLSPLVSKSGVILIPQKIEFAGMLLKGIIYSQGQALAVINGEVVKEGDKIGEYILLKVKETGVILKKGNETFTLKLEE